VSARPAGKSMMTSDRKTPESAFVWVWLPGETEPVVAGRITMDGGRYIYNYERASSI